MLKGEGGGTGERGGGSENEDPPPCSWPQMTCNAVKNRCNHLVLISFSLNQSWSWNQNSNLHLKNLNPKNVRHSLSPGQAHSTGDTTSSMPTSILCSPSKLFRKEIPKPVLQHILAQHTTENVTVHKNPLLTPLKEEEWGKGV